MSRPDGTAIASDSPRAAGRRFAPRRRRQAPWTLAFFALLLAPLFLPACSEEFTQPPYLEVVELYGSHYERGLQHGRKLASKIRSFYTRLLTNSILPWLNREQPGIAEVLTAYNDPEYQNGRFSTQLMVDSARNLVENNYLPEEFVEEMRGVADGVAAVFPEDREFRGERGFEKILVLNTFTDTLFSVRSVAFLLRLAKAPRILRVEFLHDEGDGRLTRDWAQDGIDNDGDGEIDEPSEGMIAPYAPSTFASMVEVPEDAVVLLAVEDQDYGTPLFKEECGYDPLNFVCEKQDIEGCSCGVDEGSVRVQLDDRIIEAPHASLRTEVTGSHAQDLNVYFTPPGGLSPASVVSLQFQSADLDVVSQPPPDHAQVMRDERIVFTTKGYGKEVQEVFNEGKRDPRFQPPSIGFAVRGTATRENKVFAAHHFALLDTDVSHKHTVLFVHHPENGHPYVTLGYGGVIWGFSGLNSEGMAFALNIADSLDNTVTAELLANLTNLAEAKLLVSGLPGGMIGKEILENDSTVAEALDTIRARKRTFGWNFLLADAQGDMAIAETDADADGDPRINMQLDDPNCACCQEGFCPYTPDTSDPENLDPWGRPWASVGPDDLRMSIQFRKNENEIRFSLLGTDLVRPQRFWTTYYYRALRAYAILGQEIDAAYGDIDVDRMIQILRVPDLVDMRDSMNASVLLPNDLKVRYAMGQVPATAGPFFEYDLGKRLNKRVQP